jgi:nucleoside-diphosphate-sugar epimerase
VYGETRTLPMREDHPTVPLSPYGATKLSGEHLCELYRLNYGITYRALRYFTVYGPRQRPDMAFSRFITASLEGTPIEVYGDGRQTRDFTFVADAVEANIRAMRYDGPLAVFNIGGGSRASVLDVLDVIGRELGGRLDARFVDKEKGDVTDTWADTSRARDELGFMPRVGLEEGIRREIEWYRSYNRSSEGRRRSS